jgi:hypothetical protein
MHAYSAHDLKNKCEEDPRIIVAHTGEGDCDSCKLEAGRLTRLAELYTHTKGECDAITRLIAIKCGMHILRLKPLEVSLQQISENKNALENDLNMCKKLRP